MAAAKIFCTGQILPPPISGQSNLQNTPHTMIMQLARSPKVVASRSSSLDYATIGSSADKIDCVPMRHVKYQHACSCMLAYEALQTLIINHEYIILWHSCRGMFFRGKNIDWNAVLGPHLIHPNYDINTSRGSGDATASTRTSVPVTKAVVPLALLSSFHWKSEAWKTERT